MKKNNMLNKLATLLLMISLLIGFTTPIISGNIIENTLKKGITHLKINIIDKYIEEDNNGNFYNNQK